MIRKVHRKQNQQFGNGVWLKGTRKRGEAGLNRSFIFGFHRRSHLHLAALAWMASVLGNIWTMALDRYD